VRLERREARVQLERGGRAVEKHALERVRDPDARDVAGAEDEGQSAPAPPKAGEARFLGDPFREDDLAGEPPEGDAVLQPSDRQHRRAQAAVGVGAKRTRESRRAGPGDVVQGAGKQLKQARDGRRAADELPSRDPPSPPRGRGAALSAVLVAMRVDESADFATALTDRLCTDYLPAI
jgi:hypothetical protein